MVALVLVKSRSQHSEACRDEERGANPLDRAAGDERGDVRREATCNGGHGEYCNAEKKDASTAVKIGSCPSNQHHRAQQQQVGIDDPLRRGHACMQGVLNRRQGDIHRRAIDQCHARPEYGRRQRQSLASLRQCCVKSRCRPDNVGFAGRLYEPTIGSSRSVAIAPACASRVPLATVGFVHFAEVGCSG